MINANVQQKRLSATTTESPCTLSARPNNKKLKSPRHRFKKCSDSRRLRHYSPPFRRDFPRSSPPIIFALTAPESACRRRRRARPQFSGRVDLNGDSRAAAPFGRPPPPTLAAARSGVAAVAAAAAAGNCHELLRRESCFLATVCSGVHCT